METLTIELTNPKALNLLQEMESLQLIKVLSRSGSKKGRVSAQLRGSISAQEANAMNDDVRRWRDEWERPI